MSHPSIEERFAAAQSELDVVGQGHVLRFYDDLSNAGKEQLLAQIEGVDWREVAGLIETHVHCQPPFNLPERLEPAPYYPRVPDARLKTKYDEARLLGERLVREGKLAAFTVAGGQGTRLGWDAPKGTFPATPIRKAPLFQVFAEGIGKAQDKYAPAIPWYVMTSPANHGDTLAFFKRHEHFGLDPANVMLFPQGMMPAIDMTTGKALLAGRDRLALSPNGHGGSLKALHASGAVTDMIDRGIEHISYVQVDNPLVHVVDPLFLGLHALDGSAMSSKMLPKAHPKEKLGNFCLADGKITVIEYSDLPDELAHQRLADGTLRFLAGSIAIHLIRVDFVQTLNQQSGLAGDAQRPGGSGGAFGLPFHRAQKKVPFVDLETGELIEPREPNAVKLETFVFDALPLCPAGSDVCCLAGDARVPESLAGDAQRPIASGLAGDAQRPLSAGSIILETDRVEEFAPIKNADTPAGQPPAADSPQTSRQLQIERAARWLESRGVPVARDGDGKVNATIEIAPAHAIEPADLDAMELPRSIRPGDEVLL